MARNSVAQAPARAIGDTARGRRERAEGAGVNYRGLDVRRERNWLPETDTDPKLRLENFRKGTFSALLTKTIVSDMRLFTAVHA
jgi:hypothetical protein